jgi:hypothetical protein
MFVHPVGHKSLQGADGHRAIELPSIAVVFAGMIADPSNRSREGVVFLDHLKCFFVAPGLDQSNVTLCAGLGRTGVLAGARATFRHQESIGNRLRIRTVDRLPLIQSSIEFVREENGADIGAVIAARAFLEIDVTGSSPDLGPEIPGLSLEGEELGVGNDPDVEMAACLDQFRREDAH